MKSKSVVASGASLLAILRVLTYGHAALAAGRGGAPPARALAAPRVVAPMRSFAPQMRSTACSALCSESSFPQGTVGGFQNFQIKGMGCCVQPGQEQSSPVCKGRYEGRPFEGTGTPFGRVPVTGSGERIVSGWWRRHSAILRTGEDGQIASNT